MEHFQKKALDEILKRKKCLFANPTGTGKTHFILRNYIKIKEDQGHKCLVVCPKNAKIEWVFHDKVFHYEQLLREKPPEHDTLVVDECHRIKNYDAKASRKVINLLKKVDSAVLCSATPSEHFPLDYYWLLKLCIPDFPYEKATYKFEFCKQAYVYGDWRFVNVLKDKEAGEKLKKLIDSVTVKTIKNNFTAINNKFLKENIVFDSGSYHDRMLSFAEARIENIKNSFDFLLKVPALWFCMNISTADKLGSILKCPVITGKTHNKPKVIKNWLQGPVQSLVCTYKTAGVGLNLNKLGVDTVVLFQKSFSPKTELQALSRITRWKTKKEIDVYHFDSQEPQRGTFYRKKIGYYDIIENQEGE